MDSDTAHAVKQFVKQSTAKLEDVLEHYQMRMVYILGLLQERI